MCFTDWVYRSKVNFFLYESAEFTGKALTEGGLRVGYSWATASTKRPASCAT
jgi:iron complex outermembrane receptor protein